MPALTEVLGEPVSCGLSIPAEVGGVGLEIACKALEGIFPTCSSAIEPPTGVIKGRSVDVVSMLSPLLRTLHQTRLFECPHMARYRLPCDRQDGSELANRDLRASRDTVKDLDSQGIRQRPEGAYGTGACHGAATPSR